MGLVIDIDHRLGDFHLRASFSCEGRLTALFGESGSGKTSIVNAIAGLLRPARARIVVDGVTLSDTGSGLFVPTHRRHVGYVFQEARLFPHMNVQQNLLYSQWFGGRKASPGASFETVVDMLGVGHLLRRYPSHLSGGERQRVAIGRALLSHPRLLLMDEPLASLDDARKQEILPYIERLRDEAGIPIIYVSHSPAEVSRLADFVVVLEAGRVAFAGAPGEALTLARGETRSADMTVLDVRGAGARNGGLIALQTDAGVILAPDRGERAPAQIGIRASDILLSAGASARTSAMNVLEGRVASVNTQDATTARVTVRVGGVDLVAAAPQSFLLDNDVREGGAIRLLITGVIFL